MEMASFYDSRARTTAPRVPSCRHCKTIVQRSRRLRQSRDGRPSEEADGEVERAEVLVRAPRHVDAIVEHERADGRLHADARADVRAHRDVVGEDVIRVVPEVSEVTEDGGIEGRADGKAELETRI